MQKLSAKDYDWYLDLDRTLFSTPKFLDAIFRLSRLKYGVSYFGLWATLFNKFTRKGSLVLFEYLETRGVKKAKALKSFRREMPRKDFMYGDAYDFLDWLDGQGIVPTILTFGDNDWQNLKLELCPRLSKYPKTIVNQVKGEYLKGLGHRRPAILVDDKDHQLPDWCVGVLVQRGLTGKSKFKGFKVRKLNQIQNICL